MRSIIQIIFTVIFIVALFMLSGCTNFRINRHLQRSKLHLLKAQALGWKPDSVKTKVQGTVNIGNVIDMDSTVAKIDTTSAVDACAELLSTMANISASQKRLIDSLISLEKFNLTQSDIDLGPNLLGDKNTWTYSYMYKDRAAAIKALQKELCPNDSVNTPIAIPFTIDGEKHQINGILKAWSKAGKAGYNFRITGNQNFKYAKTEISAEYKPVEHIGMPNWWLLIAFFLGICVGVIGMILIRRI